jgi:hypothetical protein
VQRLGYVVADHDSTHVQDVLTRKLKSKAKTNGERNSWLEMKNAFYLELMDVDFQCLFTQRKIK